MWINTQDQSATMKKFFGIDSKSRSGRRMSLQVIPDNHEVIQFKDDEMDETAVMKMIQKQRKRRGSLPGPQPYAGQNPKVGQNGGDPCLISQIQSDCMT